MQEFNLPRNDKFRKWYFNTYTSEQLKIFKEKYYKYLDKIGTEISFFCSSNPIIILLKYLYRKK